MISRQEVLSWLAQAECVRFKERQSNVLYDAKLVGDFILVRKMPPFDKDVERLTVDEFIERFEESYV